MKRPMETTCDAPSRPAGMLLALAACLCLPSTLPAESWPQWAGPTRNWRTTEPAGEWPPVKLWHKTIGDGDGSPIIVDGRVYYTSLDGDRTAVSCLDAETGEVLWTQTSPGGRYGRYARGDKNAYCGPLSTPACDGRLVFTLSVDGDLACWDVHDGKPQWGFNLYDRYRMGTRDHIRDYGYAGSPMLAGDDIYVEVGGNRGAVMAFRKTDGRVTDTWGTGQIGHSSGPAGPGGRVFFGLDYLWIGERKIPWRTDCACNIATPAVSGPYVVCTSGYNMIRTNCYENGREKWSVRFHEKSHSPAIHEEKGNVYLTGRGLCLNLDDGEAKWRFGTCSSVVITGDHKVIVFGNTLQLFDANGNRLHEVKDVPRKGWPSGAFGEGKILCKNRSTLVCYALKSGD